jgi:hypothetical protein
MSTSLPSGSAKVHQAGRNRRLPSSDSSGRFFAGNKPRKFVTLAAALHQAFYRARIEGSRYELGRLDERLGG